MSKTIQERKFPPFLLTRLWALVAPRTLHTDCADPMTTTTLAPLQDIISPKFHQNNFAEEAYVKNDLGIKLDKGV